MPSQARKQFRSRMWLYRRRRGSLTPEQQAELEALFVEIPELELPYHFREDVAEVFDAAQDRQEAACRLEQLRAAVVEAGAAELLKFFAMYDRWRDGILAYFDDRQTSGPVEGLNAKARVITRRSYGLKQAASLWRRLVLDSPARRVARRSVQELHALARHIRAQFRLCYT